MFIKRAIGLLTVFMVLLSVPSFAADAAGLKKGLETPGAVKSVFFIEGMSCRACTTILDKRIAKTPGVFWSRFNFPLRLLSVFHDPKTVSKEQIAELVNHAGEVKAVFLSSVSVPELNPIKRERLAEWNGGKVMLGDVIEILMPFKDFVQVLMEGTSEISQVRYEIIGENLRNKIIYDLAKKAGYDKKAKAKEMPPVIQKDFYWPEKLRPLSAEEKVIAFYVEAEVTKGDFENGAKFFDAWLQKLWRDIDFTFYGEFAEGKL